MLWRYKLAGPHRPQRGKFRRVKMRNWERRIWQFEGAAVVCNLKTAEIWLTSRSYSSPQRMLACNRMRADLIRRRFSKWQEVALELIEAPHPEGVERLHAVIDEKKHGPHFQHLKNQLGREDAARIGLKTDDSHPGHVELDGPASPEGMLGMDWLALAFPDDWRGFNSYISSSLNEITRVVKMEKQGLQSPVLCSGVIRENVKAGAGLSGTESAKDGKLNENGGAGSLLRGGPLPCFTEMVWAGETPSRSRGISASNWGRWARAWRGC